MTERHVGEALRHLLGSPGAKAIWAKHAIRRGRGELNYRAIATAVAVTVHDDATRASGIHKRIAAAVDTGRASRVTVDELADTFQFPSEARSALCVMPTASDEDAQRMLDAILDTGIGQRPYRTVLLREHHYLGPDGLPRRHETVQTIAATRDGVDVVDYRYVPGDGIVSVEVTDGGVVIDSTPAREGVVATHIKLDRRLSQHETMPLTYVSTFDYNTAPEQAFRRGTSAQVELIDILVTFDSARLPTMVWEVEWADQDGAVVTQIQRVHPDSRNHSVHLFRPNPGRTFLGFRWEW
jgi:hypothetical protein